MSRVIFDELGVEGFLRDYLWVIFVSGFRNSVVEEHFDTIVEKFHGLDLDRIAAMKSIDAKDAADPQSAEGGCFSSRGAN